MANPYIWADLARANNDPTTIDEAIGVAIQAHDDDPDAHLDVDQSLQSHRASEIIDHIAESVVNDKISHIARTYTAIVDPGSDVDYDTIESAHAYAVSVGGGSVYIVPGEYYLSTKIEIDGSVNFYGSDKDSVIIHTDNASNKFFETGYWSAGWGGSFNFQNITFIADSPIVFTSKTGASPDTCTMQVNQCLFKGEGGYITFAALYLNINECVFYLTTLGAIQPWGRTNLTNIECRTVETSGTIKFFDESLYGEVPNCTITGLTSDTLAHGTFSGMCDWFGATYVGWLHISDSWLSSAKSNTCEFYGSTIINTVIDLATTQAFNARGTDCSIFGCLFLNGATPNFIVDSTSSAFAVVGNRFNSTPSINSTSNYVNGNSPYTSYATLSTGATACAFNVNEVAQLTPNSTRTLTSVVPTAGQRRTLIILTSGTTNYTLTFGTGFKTTGTLATGTTSARRYIVEFISDGTQLIETSRTVAIA